VAVSKKEKEELKRLASSSSLREDMRRLAANRHNPLIANELVDIDRLLIFLSGYNEFINHARKPFNRMVDRLMKL
jgi:hypothetical protein